MRVRRDDGRGGRRRGHALLAALIVTLSVGALGVVVASLGELNARRASTARDEDQLRQACRAGLAQARLVLWDRHARLAPPTLDSVRAHLDELGLSDGDVRWLAPGGAGLADAPGAALTLSPGAGVLLVTTAVEVSTRRQDGPEDTFLFLRADAACGGERRFAEEVVRLGRRPFEGFRYALLADSIDRVLDRATFDNADRTRLGKDGPHARVKVGSIGPLRLSATPRTRISGTLYTPRAVLNPGGAEVAAPPGGTNGLRAEGIDAGDGTLTGPPYNDLVDSTPGGQPFGNLYARYPEEPAEQFDGFFPAGGIPAPIPDPDGDRRISDGEWSAFAADKGGRVHGSVLLGVLPTDPLPLPVGLPSLGNLLQFEGAPSDTNLLVVGTALTPTRIDGDVAVDGDLVITGPITGTGVFYVRGNIYLLGDVTYADPQGDTVGFVAGGSIVTGDYRTTPALPLPPPLPQLPPIMVSDSTLSGWVAREMAAYNRMEWTRAQPFYDEVTRRPTGVDTGVANSAYVPGYVPRYYTLAPGADPRMFLGAAEWRNGTGVWTGGAGDPDTVIGVAAGGAVVAPLDPTSGWLSPLALYTLQTSAALLRLGSTTRIDGLLYSNNAILLRGPTSGAVRVMGAIIGRDVGVQGPAGIWVDYDDRVRELLDLEDAGPETVAARSILRREQ
ncbi:MAG: hypothetical protein KF878_14640 [Planctomycetes bacterium]|nr:hypothetical protein [Planctomycetota bacterium]